MPTDDTGNGASPTAEIDNASQVDVKTLTAEQLEANPHFNDLKTKYSAAGYKLSFKGGTNTTKVPNAVDKKSKVSITGMTLTKPATVWTAVSAGRSGGRPREPM